MAKSDPRAIARRWAARFEQTLAPRLQGIVLYGSAARSEFIEGVSDINVAFLFDEIDMPLLERASPLVREAAADAISVVPFDWDDRQRAADSFGIELLDMQDAHEVLSGADPFADLTVPRPALRLQTERELRARLVALDGRLLRSESDEHTGALLMAALPAFVTYQRAALRLARRNVPLASPEVIDAACALVGADPAGLRAAEEARRMARKWAVKLGDPVAGAFRSACRRTASFVDEIDLEGSD